VWHRAKDRADAGQASKRPRSRTHLGTSAATARSAKAEIAESKYCSRFPGAGLPRLINDAAFVCLAEAPPMTIARRRNDERRLRRSHMTKTMTKGMTKPMTKPAAPVEQLARRQLGFGFELRSPVAERLERKPVGLTILSLIQIALPPRLVVRAPKDLAVTLARPSCVRHLFLLTLPKRPVRTDRVRQAQNKRANNGRLRSLDKNPCSSKKIP